MSALLSLLKSEEILVASAYLYPLKGFYFAYGTDSCGPSFAQGSSHAWLFLSLCSQHSLSSPICRRWHFLAIFQGNLAWFNAVFLVLGESASIIALLFEAFFVDEALVEIFDAVLIHQTFPELVRTRRAIIPPPAPTRSSNSALPKNPPFTPPSPSASLSNTSSSSHSHLFPLPAARSNCLVLGRRAGPFHHWRYFKLLGLSKADRAAFIKKRQWKYTWFGMVAQLLQLVPMLCNVVLAYDGGGCGTVGRRIWRGRRRASARVGRLCVSRCEACFA
ncbi:hypothetical protein B0H14DRAFT_1285657 [Mycena olivaceomarginata]|nr:hypothetical protein B0H14DRAFT_1285657 [Mycena olivaceomarginata]